MTENDLVDVLAVNARISQTQASRAVETIIKTLTDALARGESVALAGFGTFSVRNRAERTSRAEPEGALKPAATRRVAGFKPDRVLRSKVSG